MVKEKELGKIESVKFGRNPDRPFLFGLQLTFKMEGAGVQNHYTVNLSENCKWETADRSLTIVEMVEFVDSLLENAKVNYVSELKNVPVEITFNGNCFKSFRILTEVL